MERNSKQFLKNQEQDKVSTFSILIHTVLSFIVPIVLARSMCDLGEIKVIPIGKEEVKVSLLEDDMIVYINNTKCHWKIPKVDQFFRTKKITGFKINSRKSVVAFLYANDKWNEKEIRETSFTTGLKNVQYIGVTLPKQVKYSYNKKLQVSWAW
jgi:hypothetical protein